MFHHALVPFAERRIIIMNDFNRMISIVDECLKEVESESGAQAIVLLAQSGQIYRSVIPDAAAGGREAEKQLIQELKSRNDRVVAKLVCKWADGGLDLPSCSFRELLCECNEDNRNAKILLTGGNGYLQKTIEQTIRF